MTNKKEIKSNLKFLFFFKIFPFIKNENIEKYIKDIISYYIKNFDNNAKYIQFIKYFLKN